MYFLETLTSFPPFPRYDFSAGFVSIVTIAFFQSGVLPSWYLTLFVFPLTIIVLTFNTLTSKSFSTALAISTFVPLSNNIFYTYFDDEGVAKTNKTIIDKGVLKTYLYNLETANKDGVETTGNASNRGNKIGVSFTNLYLKPGKKSEEELFAKIGNGLYITGVSGLHAGLNAQSGNFSLEAEGFLIKDGKLDKPVSLITVAGNLMTLFKDIKEVANNSELLSSGTTTASVYVKSLAISGK